jgi:hypothetical protein
MKKRTWDPKTKAKIVLEGLSGKPISEICSQYQISQNQYYQWRDKFLSESQRAFEGKAAGFIGSFLELTGKYIFWAIAVIAIIMGLSLPGLLEIRIPLKIKYR